MKKNIIKIAGLAIASAFALSAQADVAIHQNVSLYGYAAGSVQYSKGSASDYNSGKSDTTTDIDAAKLGLAFNFAPVTAKVSIYTDAGADDLYILEANATYDIGNGLGITGGRFQSWIGYEAFDIPNGNFITNGADVFGYIIPNFHEGLRVDYSLDKMSFGLAVVNSVYPVFGGYRGDGSLSDGYGVEAHFGYNDGAFSLGATLAYQNTRASAPGYNMFLLKNTYVADVWAQYVLNQTTFGAELYYNRTSENSDLNSDICYGLVMVKQQFNEKFTLAGRLSIGQEKWKYLSDKPNFWKASVQPAYAVTQNLSIGVEINYAKYNKASQSSDWFYGLPDSGYNTPKNQIFVGVQAVFKF